jgi:hypothetical protein
MVVVPGVRAEHIGGLVRPDAVDELDGNLDRETVLGDDRQLVEAGGGGLLILVGLSILFCLSNSYISYSNLLEKIPYFISLEPLT